MNSIKNKNFIVYGLSKTGLAVVDFLKKNGATAFLLDDEKDVYQFVDNKQVFQFNLLVLKRIQFTALILSPGVPLNNKVLEAIRHSKIKIMGEIEFAFNFCKTKNIVGITGTNGKTTVTELVTHIISKVTTCHKGGNIGTPFISFVDRVKKQDIVVLELSSFQLETINRFRPKISCILNLKPDHLDRYENADLYYKAKRRIYKNQKRKDFCIINADDTNTKKYVTNCKSKIKSFSLQSVQANAYTKNQTYIISEKRTENEVMYFEDSALKGAHNNKNILCAILICRCLKIDFATIKNAIKEFKPLEHRIEFVKNIDGVEYINDSKGTNIDATLNALTAFQGKKIHLLLGGSDKGEDYATLFENLSNNVVCYIYGQTTERMKQAIKHYECLTYFFCNNMLDACQKAKQNAQPNEVVLLSPATASFDEFSSYAMRGEKFKSWVINNE